MAVLRKPQISRKGKPARFFLLHNHLYAFMGASTPVRARWLFVPREMGAIPLQIEVDVWCVLRAEIRGMLGVENTPYENGSATDGLADSSRYGGRGSVSSRPATGAPFFWRWARSGRFPGIGSHAAPGSDVLTSSETVDYVSFLWLLTMGCLLVASAQTARARLPLSSVRPGAHPSFPSWLPAFTYRIAKHSRLCKGLVFAGLGTGSGCVPAHVARAIVSCCPSPLV
ncbi:hypothetical protein B0H14DRAFT_3438835 [Mycena olivaceomarginata]|nr:hypothetical protein B0H14DRAFT_3438835 [Mycena olivaceomarginata]